MPSPPSDPQKIKRAPPATFDVTGRPMPDDSVAAASSPVDTRHLLLVGAGPGLGMAIARRFVAGGYRVSLVARSTDGLGDLANSLADTGVPIDTIKADASDPEGLKARMTELSQCGRRTRAHHLQRGDGCSGQAP